MTNDPGPDPIEIAPLEAPPVPRRVLPLALSPPPLHSAYFVRERPAIVTTMGTVAIVIAVMSLLASGIAGVAALVMWVATQVTAAPPVFTARTTPATIHSTGQTRAGSHGFNEAQRRVVMHVLQSTEALTPQQQAQLEQLLT